MNQVKIRKIVFGEGRPKICVPITGRTGEEIALRTAELKAAKPDLAEWRADWYEEVFDRKKLEEMLERHVAIYQGLGGSFDVYTGNVKRAPKWWVDHGLEWAYRLVKQPSRIKRQVYLVKFLLLVKLGRI